MGNQSSRIIWGKNKLPGGNEATPVDLYRTTDIVYVSGNYCIYSPETTQIGANYKLYLCTAAETGGTFFNSEDWKEQKGVKNWLLEGHRVYKVGARVIREAHGEEYEYVDEHGDIQIIELDGVYLFKCIEQTPLDGMWHPECWEVVFQDVGLAYIVRDHKDVYYDDGHNRRKWHRMMYYIPPEGLTELDLEVGEYDENWLYHYGDFCLFKPIVINEYRLYKFINTMPTSGSFNPVNWEMQENKTGETTYPVQMYQTYTEYEIGNKVIKLGVLIHLQVISPYDGYQFKYSISKYCLYPIDKDDYLRREIDAGERLFPNWYRDKIINGEELYGLFRATSVEGNGDGIFNPNHWELVNYRDGHYVMQWIPVNNGDPYVVGDERIYFYADPNGGTSSIMGLCRCIQAHITPTTANCPTNGDYWEPVTQYLDNRDGYKVYKALRHITAENNTHFEPNNWAVMTHNTMIDDENEFYGIIWEKYGMSGTDGYVYCFMFTSLGPYNNSNGSYKGRFCTFLPAYYDDGELNAQDDFTLYLETGRKLRGSGFTQIRNYMFYSYGIPELYSIGNAVYANFLYTASLEQGWVRTEFNRYFNFRQFVAFDENGDIYKVQFIPGSSSTETLVTPSNGYFYREMLDSEFLIVEHANPVVSLNTHIIGLYGAQIFRYYISENLAEIGEHCYDITMPPGTQTDSQYLICTKDTLLGSDVIAEVGYYVDDKYVSGSASDYQEFCNYWGLTYSNNHILNYPELNRKVYFNNYTCNNFKGDKVYVLRCAYNDDDGDTPFFIGKIVEISKGITSPVIHNITIDGAIPEHGLSIYCRYENHLYGISSDGVWDINLADGYTLSKVRSLSTADDVIAAKCVTGIPYVTGGSFKFENKDISSLTLYFADGEISRHSYSYDSTTGTLSVYIPINDRNLFSCNTGLAAQANFGTFFQDRISVGTKHYGIYIYLPEFNGVNRSNTGGYFWMSYGYTDYVNGPFIGGAGTDDTSF